MCTIFFSIAPKNLISQHERTFRFSTHPSVDFIPHKLLRKCASPFDCTSKKPSTFDVSNKKRLLLFSGSKPETRKQCVPQLILCFIFITIPLVLFQTLRDERPLISCLQQNEIHAKLVRAAPSRPLGPVDLFPHSSSSSHKWKSVAITGAAPSWRVSRGGVLRPSRERLLRV